MSSPVSHSREGRIAIITVDNPPVNALSLPVRAPVEAARKLPGPVFVVKSQIHAGGRGAGRFADDPAGKGGVRLAKSLDEVRLSTHVADQRNERTDKYRDHRNEGNDDVRRKPSLGVRQQ